ncbi:MAG: AI-2E family transporter [Prochlorococcus sp.]|nr:AI-2E family transporter [Prochlorococcus sp.]
MKFSQWLGLAALISAAVLVWSLRDVVIHIFAGIVLAMALCTLVGELRSRRPMPRLLALLLCLLGLMVLMGTALAVVVPPFTHQFHQLLLQLPAAARELWSLTVGGIDNISNIVYGDDPSRTWHQQLFPNGFKSIPNGSDLANGVGKSLSGLLGLAGNLGSGLVQILFVLAVTLMVAVQPTAYKNVAIMLVPSFYRRRAGVILLQCGDALTSWMAGLLISSLCVAALAGIGLSLLGVKLVMANALLAGLLNVIPNVGPTLSTIFPMAVALLDAPWKALAVLGLYVVIQNLESYLITPSVMQHQVKLLPGLTLTAQFVFTVIFGPLGLLLALPLAVVIQVLIREIVIHDLLDPWKRKRLAS